MDKFTEFMQNGILVGVIMFAGVCSLLLAAIFIYRSFSSIPKAIKICISILFLYCACIMLSNDAASGYNMMITAMPFVGKFIKFGDLSDTFSAFRHSMTDLSLFFDNVVEIFYLAFFINILQVFQRPFERSTLLNMFFWYVKECIIACVAIVLNAFIRIWLPGMMPDPEAAAIFADNFMTFLFVGMAALFVVLSVMRLFSFKAFDKIPIFGKIWGFITGGVIGQSLIAAMLSTSLIIIAVCVLGYIDDANDGAISATVKMLDTILICGFTMVGLSIVGYIVHRLWLKLKRY